MLEAQQRVLHHVLLLDNQLELQLLRLLTRRLWLEDRVSRFLHHVVYDNDSSLRVDGFDGFRVGCTLTFAEEVREHVAVIADKEGVRHEGKLLRVLVRKMNGRCGLVRDNVVHILCPTGARVAQPHDLDGGWLEGKDLIPRSFGVAIHVD